MDVEDLQGESFDFLGGFGLAEGGMMGENASLFRICSHTVRDTEDLIDHPHPAFNHEFAEPEFNKFPQGISATLYSQHPPALHSQHPSLMHSQGPSTSEPTPLSDSNGERGHREAKKKNLLRNMGQAQNNYILFNRRARAIVKERVNDVQEFDSWVRSLRLSKFGHFRAVWKGTNLYHKLHRELSWKFYKEEAVCYILHSRIGSEHMKQLHLKYICRLMKGIESPDTFRRFKQ